MWQPLEVEGHPAEAQNPCRDVDCGSKNSITVNIFSGPLNPVSQELGQLRTGITVSKDCKTTPENQQAEEFANQEVETIINTDEVTEVPTLRDDRPVPLNIIDGTDGFLYFLGNETFDTPQGCRGYCHRFRGFRLAIAKTKENLDQIKKCHQGMVDLSIIRWGASVKLLWGDGTELDRSIVNTSRGEPLINQPGKSDVFVMWPPGSTPILDDLPNGLSHPCICQGSAEVNLC